MIYNIIICLLFIFSLAVNLILFFKNKKINLKNIEEAIPVLEKIAEIAVNSAEQVGEVQNLSGYEKLDFAMQKFNDLCKAFGLDKISKVGNAEMFIEAEVFYLNKSEE